MRVTKRGRLYSHDGFEDSIKSEWGLDTGLTFKEIYDYKALLKANASKVDEFLNEEVEDLGKEEFWIIRAVCLGNKDRIIRDANPVLFKKLFSYFSTISIHGSNWIVFKTDKNIFKEDNMFFRVFDERINIKKLSRDKGSLGKLVDDIYSIDEHVINTLKGIEFKRKDWEWEHISPNLDRKLEGV